MNVKRYNCRVCGSSIPWKHIEDGTAIHELLSPATDITAESWENRCRVCTLKKILRIALDELQERVVLPERGHVGFCGPESGCDNTCSELYHYFTFIETAKKLSKP